MHLIGANQFIPGAAMGLAAAAALFGCVSCVCFAVSLIRRQIKLTHSIVLVELRSGKTQYVLFMSEVTAMLVAVIIALCGGNGFEREVLTGVNGYGMSEWQAALLLGCILVLLLSADLLLVVLLLAKSAVTDLGIYFALNFFGWYHVRDYIIDEAHSVVLIGTQKETFSAVKGVMFPLRVRKNDIPKLKFILNKNKNKFTI